MTTPEDKARSIAEDIYDMAWQRGSTKEVAIERITQALRESAPTITDEEIEREACEFADGETNYDPYYVSFIQGAKWVQKKMRGDREENL